MITEETKPPIVNCHTHIFTGDCVPPWLAKSIVPWPLYFLMPVSFIVKIFRFWFSNNYSPYKWRFQTWYKKLARALYLLKINLTRYGVLRFLKTIVGAIIVISIFFGLYDWKIKSLLSENDIDTNRIDDLRTWLTSYRLLIITESFWVKAILLIVLLIFFPTGKNLILFVLKKTSRFFQILPGKQTSELLKRYINIIRFARYEKQSGIFSKLAGQYPPETGIIVLPMDMEYMGAGKPPKKYDAQMAELAVLKESKPGIIYPFIFVDPRRTEAGNRIFFDYTVSNGTVTLKECFIKDYIETHQFSGFKIYPALGYFPFDEMLLPLWKYAADNNIPVTTHCIRGVIFYRGRKKKEWDFHPVFKQAMGKGKDQKASPDDLVGRETEEDYFEESGDHYEPMLLPQMDNEDFQEIFTHPLNYLCLLEEKLLRQLVAGAKDSRIKDLFGYTNESEPLKHNLNSLKICFAHFGGEDEWKRFFEKDRDNYSSQLAKKPGSGINFLADEFGTEKPGKPEQVWKYADWYSIICSLILQYPNIYADISYILHGDDDILPLLKQTLQNPGLKRKVLFGTDFYVVRNHKSDKNMLSDMLRGLTEEEFQLMAVENPVEFLKTK
jgi:predicted TIM-barrel fold metal-dependent hydrolase